MRKLTEVTAALGITLFFFMSAAAVAKPDATWNVEPPILSKHDGEKSEDVSGIACTGETFPRHCLVIDDNSQSAQFVTIEDGAVRADALVPLISNMFHRSDKKHAKTLELDGEGVAYANGAFYVMGSHGWPRHPPQTDHRDIDADETAARLAASSQVVRIRLKPNVTAPSDFGDVEDVKASPKLKQAILDDPVLKSFYDRPLDQEGITIEGVAVLGDRLFAGFREPSFPDGSAPILSVSLDYLFGEAPAKPELQRLPLGNGVGIRDLAPFDGGLLVLSGPIDDAPGPYKVHWWNAKGDEISFLADITDATDASAKHKPEAILPLDRTASGLRVLILSDGRKSGGPLPVVVPYDR